MLALAATGRDDAAARFLAALREQAERSVPMGRGGDRRRRRAGVRGRSGASAGAACWVVALLQPCLDQIRLLGGSNAQRDLFRQILINSAMKADRRDVVAAMIAEETATHAAPPIQRAGYAGCGALADVRGATNAARSNV